MLNINKNLYYLRISNKKNKSFNQKDISKVSRIPQTHISRIENGRESPRLNVVIFYSQFFDVSIDDIVFKEYNPQTKEFE